MGHGVRGEAVVEPLTQGGAVGVVVEGEVDTGPDVATGVTEVMASTLVDEDMDRVTFFDEQFNGVGELQLAALARLDATQGVEDGAVEQVAAGGDDG